MAPYADRHHEHDSLPVHKYHKATTMILDSWINYLKPSNSSRITGLSIHDPFAIAGFIMLLIMFPVALILLTITSRRSAESIWDGVLHDSRFRSLQRSRVGMSALLMAGRDDEAQSQNSRRAATNTKRVRFMPRTSPRPPNASRTLDALEAQEEAPMLHEQAPWENIPLEETHPMRGDLATLPSQHRHVSTAPRVWTGRYSLPDFSTMNSSLVYMPYNPAPQVELLVEDAEASRRWTRDFQEQLQRTAVDSKQQMRLDQLR